MPSENVYGNALLNDMHTVFPALLYEPERFATVADVLRYVNRQARHHGDTFSRLSQQHRASTTVVGDPIYVMPGRRVRRARSPVQTGLRRGFTVAYEAETETETGADAAGLGLGTAGQEPAMNAVMESIMSTLFGQDQQPPPPPGHPFENVIVNASPALINAVSEQKIAEESTGPCAICQEDIRASEVIRKLNRPCNHIFHKTCIDRWLSQHIRCPVCRRDMRELTHSTEQSSTGPTGAPQSS